METDAADAHARLVIVKDVGLLVRLHFALVVVSVVGIVVIVNLTLYIICC